MRFFRLVSSKMNKSFLIDMPVYVLFCAVLYRSTSLTNLPITYSTSFFGAWLLLLKYHQSWCALLLTDCSTSSPLPRSWVAPAHSSSLQAWTGAIACTFPGKCAPSRRALCQTRGLSRAPDQDGAGSHCRCTWRRAPRVGSFEPSQ